MDNVTPGRRDNSDTGTTDQVEITTPYQTYPSHGTQAARFLAALLAGRQINPLLAWQDFGIYRTSDVVFRLRKLGWPVRTDDLAVDNRFGEACIVALYSLPADVIEQAGADGHEFVCIKRETLREMRRAA